MFGFAFGLAFYLLFSAILIIAQKVDAIPFPTGTNPDITINIGIVVFSAVFGLFAQLGLKKAIEKYSRH